MYGWFAQQPLLISSLLTHAERHHGEQEIVSRRDEGDIHRYCYRDLAKRCRKLANVLAGLGIGRHARVGTLASNGYRHIELLLAVPGSGAVLHAINPGLHVDQLASIIDHADSRIIFFDLSFLPLIESLGSRISCPLLFVAMTDRANMPTVHDLPAMVLCYEDLIDGHDDDFAWPLLDENHPSSLCYTSGTNGNLKEVLDSHRSTLLHACTAALPDSLNCSARDVILPAVPMFDGNAWSLPYIACMAGAKLVFPGPALDAKSLHQLIDAEQVTLCAGAPAVWQELLRYMTGRGTAWTTLRRVIVGGARCPTALATESRQRYQIDVVQASAMPELAPADNACRLDGRRLALPMRRRYAIQAKQGRAVFGIDMRIVDRDGEALSWDAQVAGDLQVRGPWVNSGNSGSAVASERHDSWLPTGDVALIDADGLLQITDRSKTVIEPDDEGASPIEIEYMACLYPGVASALCIAAAHPKWGERSLLLIVKGSERALDRDELLEFLDGRLAKRWTPDQIVFVDSLPRAATGRMLDARLKEPAVEYQLAD